jgi:hypothetical protein
MLLFGAGGVAFSLDAFRDAVKDQIVEEDRRDQIVDVTKQAEDAMKAHHKHVHEASKELIQLVRNYDTTREELEQFLANEAARRQEHQAQIVDMRFKTRGLMSAEEWSAVYEQAKSKTSDDE